MSDILERISTHLGTRDYTVEENDDGVLEAHHAHHWNFGFALHSGGVVFQSFIGARGDAEMQEFLEFINTIQRQALVAQFYLDGEGDLALEAWWPGLEYRAEGFDQFVDAWNRDVGLLAQHPKVEAFLQ